MSKTAVKFSWPVRLLIWAAVIGILLLVPLIVWNAIAQGKTYKLIVPGIIGAVAGWQGYVNARKTRIVRRSTS